jgi:hypothetical protein
VGYDLSAFVAREGTFVQYRSLSEYVTVAPLNQGFELILYDDYLERGLKLENTQISEDHRDLWISQPILTWVSRLSYQTPIAFIRADFFGGNGMQSAALWQNGNLVFKPPTNGVMMGAFYGHLKSPEAPINSVLRRLGVKTAPSQDEFEAIGLERHRHNEDWFAAYTEFTSRDYQPFD